MPYRLEDLDLEELSLVDEPASIGARIAVFKRDTVAKIDVGDRVSWSSSGGTARGIVRSIVRDGEVPGIPVKITGSEDSPAARIELLDDDGEPRGEFVGHKLETLNKGAIGMTDEQKRRMRQLMEKENMSEADAKAKVMDEYREKAEKRVDALEGQIAALTKALEGAGMTVTVTDDKVEVGKAADDAFVEVSGQKVAKASIPAPVLEAIEKQRKDLDELMKAQEIQKLDKRAEELIPNFGGTAGEKRALLKAVEGIADADTRAGVEKALGAASKLLLKSFGEIGHTGNDDDPEGPAARLDKMAAEYAEQKGVTFAKAYAEVTKTGEGAKLFAKRNAN